ncbi:uncharacterized protein Dvar_68590 [Desulfosarcina variabilis str. Montpellier]|uniref:RipA family octameric membrane protein n=1 Tax=Desulfosarcina variabilis TaxID=2300 RepID=UPI003AFAB47A
MANQKNQGVFSGYTTLEAKTERILDAYKIQLDFWKVQNDNYFKRVQILMVVIQVTLLTAAFKFIPVKTGSCYEVFALMGIAILGILSSWHWSSLNVKQNQYMEFCRRNLRNLESKLVDLGVPLRYFTLEAHVFGPLRTEITSSAGTSVQEINNRHITQFDWSKEVYPDPDTKDANIHELTRVSGGMIAFEKGIAIGLIWIWAIALILLIIICNSRIVFQYWKAI